MNIPVGKHHVALVTPGEAPASQRACYPYPTALVYEPQISFSCLFVTLLMCFRSLVGAGARFKSPEVTESGGNPSPSAASAQRQRDGHLLKIDARLNVHHAIHGGWRRARVCLCV